MDEMRARLEVGMSIRGNVDLAAILPVVIAWLNHQYMRLVSWQFLGLYSTDPRAFTPFCARHDWHSIVLITALTSSFRLPDCNAGSLSDEL